MAGEPYDDIENFWRRKSEYVKRKSHWGGYFEYFTEYQGEIRKAFAHFDKNSRPMKSFEHAIDFGVGGGAGLEVLGRKFDRVTGIDINRHSLREATRIAKLCGLRFRPIVIDIRRPEAILPVGPCDFFFCASVVQHLPSVAYAERVFLIAYDLLRPGGRAVFHIRTVMPQISGDDNYWNKWRAFTVIDEPVAGDMLLSVGFVPLVDPFRYGMSDAAYFYLEKPGG